MTGNMCDSQRHMVYGKITRILKKTGKQNFLENFLSKFREFFRRKLFRFDNDDYESNKFKNKSFWLSDILFFEIETKINFKSFGCIFCGKFQTKKNPQRYLNGIVAKFK